ncbi:MAG: right-handed parallel beta-helix repeat-containing protein, partial [Deltaproteobacteria bacterium]|nr:right-handed parallel beta-helix repeat-containing protein [Deltaproteobacteria bacterium]
GFVGSQISETRNNMPGAIYIENASDIIFERNIFAGLGASGIIMEAGASDNIVLGNVFDDIAAGGIIVDRSRVPNPSDSRAVSRGNKILNNYITRVSQEYSSAGIGALYVDNLLVEHNELYDMPYSGVAVGWGWSTNPTQSRDNIIRYNKIHNVMNLLDDGAGIYTLSMQPGTHIFENYLHDFARSQWASSFPVAGIYLDQGSDSMTVENNIIENVPNALEVFLHRASNNTIIDQSGITDDPSPSTPSLNTIINNGNINPTAIKANAGLESAYQDIVGGSSTLPPPTGTTLPPAPTNLTSSCNAA